VSSAPVGTRRHRLGRAFLAVWLPASVLAVAVVMSSHVLALPTPAVHDLEAALARAPGLSAVGAGAAVGERWGAYHVLYADCPCSQRVADSLETRGALADVAEHVLLVGHDTARLQRLEARGFLVEELSPETLHNRFSVDAAPLFFAVAPDGTVPYLGGYSERSQGEPRDAEILARVTRGAHPDPLPLFGCAVSRDLQARVDPFGIKYASQGPRSARQ
jgi:hypothetical protein